MFLIMIFRAHGFFFKIGGANNKNIKHKKGPRNRGPNFRTNSWCKSKNNMKKLFPHAPL